MAVVPRRTGAYPALSTKIADSADKVGSNLFAGEDLDACAPCYIAADGLVYMCGGSGVTTVASAGASCVGWSTRPAKAGQADPITLVEGIDFGYGTGMTPGTKLYIDCSAATKGRLNNSQAFVGLPVAAIVLDATRIRVYTAIPHPIA